MTKIQTYNILQSCTELGDNAELFLDSICYSVSNMTVRELMAVYRREVSSAEEAILISEDAGKWRWNKDRRDRKAHV